MPLTLALLQEHLGIDPGMDDAVITLYARAAVDAAESYTGRRLQPGDACDYVENPVGSVFATSAMPTGPVTARVHIGNQVLSYAARVVRGKVYLPVTLDCGVSLLEICYRVGPECDDGSVIADADPMIELGILKFVAHAWAHRGDDPNVWARDSGAISLWQGKRSLVW